MITQKKGSLVRAQHGQNNITHNSSHFKPVKGLSPACHEGEKENDELEFESHCYPAHMPSSAETSTDTVLTSSPISTLLFEPETS